MIKKNWKILSKSIKSSKGVIGVDTITSILLKNRGIKTRKERDEFFNPNHPEKIELKELGISGKSIEKIIKRIKRALKNKEKIIIYGDYDADGICATAILWETMNSLGCDVLPYIPDRFSEGYGINSETVEKLKIKNEKLKIIITVDNGIVAYDAINKAKEMDIEVIVTDHHEKGKEKLNTEYLLHTTKICGSAIAWFLAREIRKTFSSSTTPQSDNNGLELAAIGTIADVIPLFGINRALVKYGLESLNKTKRLGLLELFKEAGLLDKTMGAYEVGFIIAPRINAMGRLKNGIESLRLLCTTNHNRAKELARLLGETNKDRQQIVKTSFLHAETSLVGSNIQKALILSHASYHEGVIGLAAAELVRKYYRPAIVLSQGEMFSKASARSITGFNIIEAIRKFADLIEGGGGHPMAAGFTIRTDKIEEFKERFLVYANENISDELFERTLTIDCEINFENISDELYSEIQEFEPFGIKNNEPIFIVKDVEIKDIKKLGTEGKHLKFIFTNGDRKLEAIGFGMGDLYSDLKIHKKIDVVFSIEENIWNGNRKIQLKLRDINWNN